MAEIHPFPAKEKGPPPPTDEELAQQFALQMVGHWRVVHDWDRVMLWDDTVWVRDELRRFEYEARVFAAAIGERLKAKYRARMMSSRTYAAIVKMTKLDPALTLAVDDWDSDQTVINGDGESYEMEEKTVAHDRAEGWVNGQLGWHRPARPTDYFTKTTACRPDPGCQCPRWLEFLSLVTDGDTDLVEFLQRMCGHCLTGLTTEQKLFFLWGPGGNGKSTFVNTVAGIMGSYAVNAPMNLLASGASEHHPTELARLQGARLVTAAETDEGRPWDETRLKMLTGGEPITARFMNRDFFEYQPQFKLMVSGNHKPELRGLDDALKRRVLIVPFTVRIGEEQRILDFEALLKAEWPGILAWMIKGAHDWRSEGIKVPAAVIAATSEYFDAEDIISSWLEECSTADPDHFETHRDLFANWHAFCRRSSEHHGTRKQFVAKLKKRPDLVAHKRHPGHRGFLGCRLKSDTEQFL